MSLENRKDEVTQFHLKSVVLSRDDNNLSIDVTNCVTDFEIFENITNPYLTANLIFVDFQSVVQDYNFNGSEKVTIRFKHPANTSYDIIRIFYIDTIIRSEKATETVEQFVFHLVEDTDFESNLLNVNKSYTGKPSEIIKKIISEFIPKCKFTPFIDTKLEKESTTTIKVIVPNKDPMEAISWISLKSRTINGMPYFLYTTLGGGKRVYYTDLESLMKQTQLNLKNPYRYWQSGTHTDTPTANISSNDMQIINVNSKFSEDLYSKIKMGMVGSTHGYYDISNGQEIRVDFNINEVMDKLVQSGSITKKQKKYFYPEFAKFENEHYANFKSQKIFLKPSNRPYETGYSSVSSYMDEIEDGSYRNLVVGKSMLSYLEKNQIQITVPGRPYILGDANYTIGRLIEVHFMANREQRADNSNVNNGIDTKKSGLYLITATVHMFRVENYYIKMNLCKVKDIDDV